MSKGAPELREIRLAGRRGRIEEAIYLMRWFQIRGAKSYGSRHYLMQTARVATLTKKEKGGAQPLG